MKEESFIGRLKMCNTNIEELLNNNELDSHKITKISTKRIRARYPRLYGKNAKLPEHSYGGDIFIKEIVTDEGAKGWGFDCYYRNCDNPDEYGSFIGMSISDLFHPKKGILQESAKMLDFALHDLAGNILGIPVYKMLNTEFTNYVDCYDGAIYMNDISPDSHPGGLRAILDNCLQDYELGYRSFKIKIGLSLI